MAPHTGLPVPQRYWSMTSIWLALAMAVLDSSIANVALPTIASNLDASPAEAVWVVNAYQLTIVVSLLPFAALGESIGFRRVFLSGVALFTIASLGCTFSHSLPQLAFARAIQGFGAAGIMSVNGALVRFTYPSNMLGRGIGYNALVVAFSAAAGPTVASGVLAFAPWQWLFAINTPFGLAAILIGLKALPESPRTRSFDVFGSLLNVVMFGPIFVGIDILTRLGRPVLGTATLLLGIAAGALNVVRSRTQPHPIMPIDLLGNRMFALTVVTSIASFSAQMLAFVSLPFYFEGILQRSQVETGLLMTPWPLAVGIGAPIAGRLADRFSAAILCGGGLLLLCAGLVLLAFLPANATTIDIVWRMALCGLGFGLFQSPNNRSMLSTAPFARSGAAAGMQSTSRLVGQTCGATMAAISFYLADHAETVALAVAAALAGLAAIASISRLLYPGKTPPS
jgi:DHA2 family multidrug resistance protein-like MFS transporter